MLEEEDDDQPNTEHLESLEEVEGGISFSFALRSFAAALTCNIIIV
jgi:hypothetical protein